MERVKIAGIYNYLKNKLMVDTSKNDQHSCTLGSWICSAHLPYLPGLGFTKPSARANSPTPAERFPQLPWRMETPKSGISRHCRIMGIWRTQKPRLHPSSPVSPGGCFQKGWGWLGCPGVPNSNAGALEHGPDPLDPLWNGLQHCQRCTGHAGHGPNITKRKTKIGQPFILQTCTEKHRKRICRVLKLDHRGMPHKKMVKQDAGTSQRLLLVVMVFMLLFNVSSLSLMFYVVGVLGLFCP